MINYLIKKFVKDYEDYNEPEVRENYGIFAAMVGLISNIVLFVIKLVIGLLFKSVAIMADAVNNLMDSASSIITMIGFRLANKPADKEHPFGHARYESISGLIVAFIIMIVGFQFVQSSVNKILNPQSVELSYITIILLVFTIGVKMWQAHFNHVIGEKINSNSLLATGIDSRNDVLVTLTVLVGGVVETLFGIKIDGYIGLLLSVFIIKSGFEMVRDTVDELLGKSPSYETVKAVEDLINSHDNILGFHDLMIHNYGHNQTYASVHVEVDANQNVLTTHQIVDKIERECYEKLDINMVIHQDPVILDNPKLSAQVDKIAEIIANYNETFTFHDLRIIDHDNYDHISLDIVVHKSNLSDRQIKNDLKQRIEEVFKDSKVAITIDRNYISTEGLEYEK